MASRPGFYGIQPAHWAWAKLAHICAWKCFLKCFFTLSPWQKKYILYLFWGLLRAGGPWGKYKMLDYKFQEKFRRKQVFSEGTGISCSFCPCICGRLMPFPHQPTRGQWCFSSDNSALWICTPGWPSCPQQLHTSSCNLFLLLTSYMQLEDASLVFTLLTLVTE